jgi:hypothetical protein
MHRTLGRLSFHLTFSIGRRWSLLGTISSLWRRTPPCRSSSLWFPLQSHEAGPNSKLRYHQLQGSAGWPHSEKANETACRPIKRTSHNLEFTCCEEKSAETLQSTAVFAKNGRGSVHCTRIFLTFHCHASGPHNVLRRRIRVCSIARSQFIPAQDELFLLKLLCPYKNLACTSGVCVSRFLNIVIWTQVQRELL